LAQVPPRFVRVVCAGAAVRACAEKLLISSGRVGSFSAQCQVDRSIVKNVNSMLGTENKFSRALWNNFAEIPADQSTECGVVYEVRPCQSHQSGASPAHNVV
jgi:hypothetical protein